MLFCHQFSVVHSPGYHKDSCKSFGWWTCSWTL